jgi:hypothetical protein
MRGVKKALSFGDASGGETDSGTSSVEASALSRISRGYDDLPKNVGEYELEMNSKINVRWVNDDGVRVECCRTGEGWRTEVNRDGNNFVVAEHGSLDEAVRASKRLMTDEPEKADGDSRDEGFEEEVESVLESLDSGSMDAVSEAFEG